MGVRSASLIADATHGDDNSCVARPSGGEELFGGQRHHSLAARLDLAAERARVGHEALGEVARGDTLGFEEGLVAAPFAQRLLLRLCPAHPPPTHSDAAPVVPALLPARAH